MREDIAATNLLALDVYDVAFKKRQAMARFPSFAWGVPFLRGYIAKRRDERCILGMNKKKHPAGGVDGGFGSRGERTTTL